MGIEGGFEEWCAVLNQAMVDGELVSAHLNDEAGAIWVIDDAIRAGGSFAPTR